jgi:hypothetical protein
MKEMIWLVEGLDSKENDDENFIRIFCLVLRAYGANYDSRQPS